MAALNGWFATNGILGNAGVTSTVNIAGAAGMASAPGDHLIVQNAGVIGGLLVAFSQDGENFTGDAFRLPSNASAHIHDCNINAVKLDGSVNNVTYAVVAWRSGRMA